jgi:hypothetical protein
LDAHAMVGQCYHRWWMRIHFHCIVLFCIDCVCVGVFVYGWMRVCVCVYIVVWEVPLDYYLIIIVTVILRGKS